VATSAAVDIIMEFSEQNSAPKTGAIEFISRNPIIWAPLALSVFFVLLILTSWHGLNAPMYYDSAGWIEKQRHVFDSHSLAGVINLFPQRPLPMLSFYANFLFFDMKPVYFRLVNIFLLSICSVIVMALVWNCLRITDPGAEKSNQASAIAFCLALMFALHPLQQQVTLYIWQRSTLMATLFCYGALLIYIQVRSEAIRSKAVGYAACLGLFAVSLFSKEIAVTLPAMLLLAEIAFFRIKFRALAVRGAIYFLITLVLLSVLSGLERAHGDMANQPGILKAIQQYYLESGLSAVQVLLTQCRSLFLYLYAILLPTGANGALLYPMEISTGLFCPPGAAFAVAGIAALVALGLVCLFKRPLIGFGILFFFIGLLPEALFVPQYQYFGYRAILPSLGVLLIISGAAGEILKRVARTQWARTVRIAMAGVAIFAMAWLATLSVHKAEIWSNPVAFWQTTVAAFPEESAQVEIFPRSQAFHNLGLALQERGLNSEAAKYLSKAAKLEPTKARTLSALAKSLAAIGKPDEAAELLSRVLSVDPKYAGAYRNLADIMMDQRRFDEAETLINKGLAISPDSEELNDALGRALFFQGKADKAVAAFKTALKANPRGYISLTNLAAVVMAQGKADEAKELLSRSLEIRPDYWRTHENLGVVYAMEGKIEAALEQFRQAVFLNPTDPSARRNFLTAQEQLSEMRKPDSQGR
jgi:tetratricopeptide (TPR) repeat protein